MGTDVLRQVVKHIRQELIALGCDVRFGHRLEGLTIQGDALTGLRVAGPQGLSSESRHPGAGPGTPARDTFAMLHQAGVPMEQKPFAVGVRIEHLQREISARQYGPAWKQLPPSDYKLACHLPTGRSAFTFCVPGEVVAASSAQGQVVTNGMSFRARDGKNINGGFLVGVGAGGLPRRCRTAGRGALPGGVGAGGIPGGGGGFLAPAQRVEDFLKKRPSQGPGAIRPTYRPGVTWTELDRCLPGAVADTLRGALPLMDRKLRGFAAPDEVLTEWRPGPPRRCASCGTRPSSPSLGLYPLRRGGRATPAGSSPPPWTASGWPRPWPGIKTKRAAQRAARFCWWGEEAGHSGRPI